MPRHHKDTARLLNQAVQLGATVTKNARHAKVYCPNGALVIVSMTPSDWRAVRNQRARLRRGGLDV
jgi:hypothetical protein